jgi:uncharacterized protein (DUF885 family)
MIWGLQAGIKIMSLVDENELLEDYLKDYWDHILQFNPMFATYIGDHRYDDVLEDLSEQAICKEIDYFKDMLAKTEKINNASLSKKNQINFDIFRDTLFHHIRFYDFKTHYLPLNHLSGQHIDFPQIIEYQPLESRMEIENYIKRLIAFPRLVDQIIENMQNGIKHKITAFNKSMEYVEGQVKVFTGIEVDDNPLFIPVLKLSGEFSAEDREEIKSSVKEALSLRVTPAYKKLYRYLTREYKKHCREEEGIWALPDGAEMYRFFVKYHTSTDLSPEEIHNIGKEEVSRISSELNKVIDKIDFRGTTRELAEHLKHRKDLYPADRQMILAGFRDILTRMDKRLPDFFGRLPKAGYDIKEIEKYREQVAPAAYYYPPPKDFSRPGYFYVNTYKPEKQAVFMMESLAFHEAVPGHHLQIALMQEQGDLPEFRRYEGSTAFIEGWALYAERLAKEMGFYRDVYSEYGRLTNEIWRAVRLVIDTGIHFFKWSRDDCINYCREHTGLEDHEIIVEVDRYIVLPGQALAYKIGEFQMLRLREKAEKIFGSKFQIKEFHDRILENGALPLKLLVTVMNEWMHGNSSNPVTGRHN